LVSVVSGSSARVQRPATLQQLRVPGSVFRLDGCQTSSAAALHHPHVPERWHHHATYRDATSCSCMSESVIRLIFTPASSASKTPMLQHFLQNVRAQIQVSFSPTVAGLRVKVLSCSYPSHTTLCPGSPRESRSATVTTGRGYRLRAYKPSN
jgi:hypothetical protein